MTRHGDRPFAVADAVAAAKAVGVQRIIHVACDVESIRRVEDVIDPHPEVAAAVAIHPNDAARLHARGELAAAYDVVEAAVAHPKVVAVGETGLDYFRTEESGRPAQEASFRWHIDLAKRHGLVLQIHDRDAHDDVLRVLDEQGAPEHVVLHCFSGDAHFAEQCLDRGFYLSYAGVVTFANSSGLREALSVTPLERVLVETDAPFLAPHPWRGHPSASYLIPTTVRSMAGVLGVPAPDLCQAIDETVARIYRPWG
ncbi:MAG: AraC family transcriptional regulator [Actinomycetales bacterium]|nr:MAG: AraC family transcriptional regulator [Actinomycetales bacterium]